MDNSATTVEQLGLATAAAREGEYDAAIVKLKEILNQCPQHEIALGMLSAIYLQIGLLDKAVFSYTQLLELNPGNPLARFQLGMAHFTGANPEQALETWESLLQQEDEFMAHFHSGLALLQLERPDDANPLFEIAMQNMPRSHPFYPKLVELVSALAD